MVGSNCYFMNMTPLPSLLVSEKICNFERGTKRGTPPQFRSFGTKTSPKTKMFQTLFEFLNIFFRARWKNPWKCIQCFFKCGRSSLEIQFHGFPATILAGIWFPLMKPQVGAKNHGWRQKSCLIWPTILPPSLLVWAWAQSKRGRGHIQKSQLLPTIGGRGGSQPTQTQAISLKIPGSHFLNSKIDIRTFEGLYVCLC